MGKDCRYCGAYISDMVEVCPSCEKKVRAGASASADRAVEREETARTEKTTYTYKQEYERRYGAHKAQNDAPHREKSDTACDVSTEDEDVRQNKSICYLCYLGPLFLIPYLTRRDSDFVRYHSNQGLLLLLADVLCELCGIVPVLGGIIQLAGFVFVITGFFKGMYAVSEGIKKPLPLIGEIKILR